MKSKLIIISRDILTVILNHFLFLTAPITLFGVFQLENAHIPLFISLIIIPFYFLFLRYVVNNVILLVLLHLPMVFLAANISKYGIANVFSVIVTVCYIILSVFAIFKLKRSQDLLFPPIMIIALIFGFNVIDIFLAKNQKASFYIICALVYIPIYFIYHYIERYISFLLVSEASASNIPKKRIFTSGMKQNLLFTFASTAAMIFVSSLDFLGEFILNLGEKLFLVIRRFFLWLNSSNLKPIDEQALTPETHSQTGEIKIFNSIIFDILEIVLSVIVIALAIALFFVIIKGFWGFLKYIKVINPKNIVLKDELDIYEKCDIEGIKKQRSKRSNFTDKRGKIRKAYKKKVLKGKQEIIGSEDKLKLQYLTAKECCDKLSEPVLKELYEKAKYSNKEITSEDIKLL